MNTVAKDHCAFCDGYPLGTFARQTIEHFRPVSQFPRLAYTWANLFICCDRCQASKRERFNRLLLKPDTPDYRFERYFVVNYRTGEIEVNPGAPEQDQQRAQFTIEVYALNEHGRPQSRLLEAKKYRSLPQDEYILDDFPYRFFLV
ncbi:MAG TPA: TIGR02646 family protein [Caldilineaceae bacterium]|nr:TIGR02646 family protein [Caldilineaceae bacterium]